MTIIQPCPDCNADASIEQLSPGVTRFNIWHDDTCPTLARIEAN
ncbi:hypothetical protein [Mycetocola reblochoni]|nr:hypothetical protein [Mycetocola reblochoni]